MDAHGATDSLWRSSVASPAMAGIARTVTISCLGLLALGGLLIVVRRATGALAAPLPAGVLVGCAAILSLAALAVRRTLAHRMLKSRRSAYVAWAATSGILLLWAIGLSAAGDPTGLVSLWGLLVLEEAWSWLRLVRNSSATVEAPPPPRFSALAPSAAPTNGLGIDRAADEESDEAATQRFERRVEEDGSQAISGWVRADVAAGGRHATAHVAICPPFDRTPECFAEQMAGPAAQIKVAQVLQHGVRFEIKLDEPAEDPARVLVEFSIQERTTP